jgi:hypothetical protein
MMLLGGRVGGTDMIGVRQKNPRLNDCLNIHIVSFFSLSLACSCHCREYENYSLKYTEIKIIFAVCVRPLLV